MLFGQQSARVVLDGQKNLSHLLKNLDRSEFNQREVVKKFLYYELKLQIKSLFDFIVVSSIQIPEKISTKFLNLFQSEFELRLLNEGTNKVNESYHEVLVSPELRQVVCPLLASYYFYLFIYIVKFALV